MDITEMSDMGSDAQAEVDDPPDEVELHTFWCLQCKSQWELPVGSTSHIVHWKNGIAWYEAEHQGLMRIVK